MHRVVLALLLVSLSGLATVAQTKTVVSGTVTDPNGVPYAGGTIATQLIPSTASPTVNGVPIDGFNQPSALDANGHFSISLFCNAAGGGCSPIAPSSTQWLFTITNPGAQPPAGFGAVSFQLGITITGATQDVSATLSAAAPALLRTTGGSGTVASGTRGQPAAYNSSGTIVGASTYSVDASKFAGVDPTGATDSTVGLQNGANAAGAAQAEFFVPTGRYKTSATVTANFNGFRMRCAGVLGTVFVPSTTGFTIFRIGAGSEQNAPQGYVKDCNFAGAGRLSDGNSALQINGMSQFRVENVAVFNMDIGVDVVGNSFGSSFSNIRGNNDNVPVNLRTGAASGSDLSFYDMWLQGTVAGVQIAGGGGGYHFYGGQICGGVNNGGINDNNGSVIMSKDYLTGSTSGESSAEFDHTSFECTNNVWTFRTYNQVKLTLDSISINPANGATPAIGVYKGTNMTNSRIFSNNTVLSGFFSGASLLSFAGNTGQVSLWEEGTYSASQNPSINGTPTYVTSMAVQSGLTAKAWIVDSLGGATDVIRNWSGTCDSSTFLRGDGTCNAPATIPAASQSLSNLQASAPIAYANNNTYVASSGTTVTTPAFGSANTAGNTILMRVNVGGAITDNIACTDLNGDNFVKDYTNNVSGEGEIAYLRASNINAGSGNTITCTTNFTSTGYTVYAEEWSGIDSVNPVDNIQTQPVTSATSTTTNITTGQYGELVLTHFTGNGNPGTITLGSGFFSNSSTALQGLGAEYKLNTTAGTVAAAISWANSINAFQVAIAYRPTGTKINVHLNPVADATYDLGITNFRWRNLNLSGSITAGGITGSQFSSTSLGSAGAPPFQVQSGWGMFATNTEGLLFSVASTTALGLRGGGAGLYTSSTGEYGWCSGAVVGCAGTTDTSLSRGTAGVVTVDTSTVGNAAGTIKAKIHQSPTAAFSTLAACAAGTEGEMVAVNDSTTATWGATITGSGANHVLAYCDGTNWTVAAK